MTLQAFPMAACPSSEELNRRGPICGENYDLLLLDGARVLSAPCRATRAWMEADVYQTVLTEAERAEFATVWRDPACEAYATVAESVGRVILFFPQYGLRGRECLAVLPHASVSSMARVLLYSFSTRIVIGERLRARGNGHMRREDEGVYSYLEQLLTRHRRLVGGNTVFISDRRAFSRELIGRVKLLESFLGCPPLFPDMAEFDLVYPFRGHANPSVTSWLMLCLFCGARRSLGKALATARIVPDYERLLPMIELDAGNRTPIPAEWQEARSLAAEIGMLLEIKRTRHAMQVVLCPLSPATEPAVFYSLRAPASLVLQMRAKYQIGEP